MIKNASSLKLGVITLCIGIALLGSNLMALAQQGHASAGSFFGFFGAVMLILMAIWDFIDHYAEIHTKARMADESLKDNSNDNRPRAIFAQEDFNLLREAVQHYLMESRFYFDEEKHRQLSNLLHRLTRV